MARPTIGIARIAGERRQGGGELDVQRQRIDERHLARHPAGQVDQGALAGDDRARRPRDHRRHAVGPRHGDQFGIRVDSRARAQVRLEVAALGVSRASRGPNPARSGPAPSPRRSCRDTGAGRPPRCQRRPRSRRRPEPCGSTRAILLFSTMTMPPGSAGPDTGCTIAPERM